MPLRRVFATIKGEVSSRDLEPHRRAGALVYDRAQHLDTATDPLYRLCLWNAFALQLFADKLLEADAELDRPTAGFTPRTTFALATRHYLASAEWHGHAELVRLEPRFVLAAPLPASPPNWSGHDRPFLLAAAQASGALRAQAIARMAAAKARTDGLTHGRLEQKLELGESRARHARLLLGGAAPEKALEAARKSLRQACGIYFRLGQWAALPHLLEATPSPPPGQPDPPRVVPADPWLLTDPDAAPRLQRDLASLRAIEDMWAADPDPTATLALYREVREALAHGQIAYAHGPDGFRLGHHGSPPFAPIYIALDALELWGQALRTGQVFGLEVYKPPRGGAFRRRVVLAPDSPQA